jgi:hypothetical protein
MIEGEMPEREDISFNLKEIVKSGRNGYLENFDMTFKYTILDFRF